MYRLLIIDDEYLVRTGLQETIDWSAHDIVVVGAAKNGKEGLELANEQKPDIILLDMKMPIMDGLAFVHAYSYEPRDTNIIVLSGYKDFDYAKETFEQGVFSYLLKPIQNNRLIERVTEAIADLERKRDTHRFIRNVEKDLPVLYTQFIRDVLEGRIYDHNEIKERCAAYRIQCPTGGVIVYGAMDESVRGAEQSNHNIIQLISTMSEQVNWVTHVYPLSKTELITFCEGVDDIEQVRGLFERVVKVFENDNDVTVSIGIGSPYQSLTEIKYKFQEAKKAADDELFLLINHVSTYEQKRELKPQIREALKYIAKHYFDTITVKIVADAIFVSESYLMHSFKDDIGMTFNEYVTEYRIRKAKELLRKGNLKIYEVASMVGYNDVKYFSQVFRKKTNLTPSEYINNEHAS